MVLPSTARTQRRLWLSRTSRPLVVVVSVALLFSVHLAFRSDASSLTTGDLFNETAFTKRKHFSEDIRDQRGDSIRTKASFLQTELGDIRVVQEEDEGAWRQYFNRTEFEIEYFVDKPACSKLDSKDVSFTLTTQLSLDRLWIMEYQCARWPAPFPISIAIYLPPRASGDVVDTQEIRRRLNQDFGCHVERMQITILRGQSAEHQYPVNALRNLALQAVTTTHAAYIDSDFLISDGLYQALLQTAPALANDTYAAVVLPAFEYKSDCGNQKHSQAKILKCLQDEWQFIPKTKSDLIKLLDRKDLPRVERGFQKMHGKNIHHGTTMYKTWTQAAESPSPPVSIPCIKTPGYEPYLAVRVCNELPRFPEAFKGWGYNKIIWIKLLLKKLGYRLWQVQDGFVMHVPHEYSASRKQTDGHPPEFDTYLDWLTRVPPHPNHLPSCIDWKKEHGPLQP